ncbi:hypothetical protein [Nonomuraea recticatena]|uniref:hypothetical protein n=1 Tax=Nonomuraea recticatena TaxID=46178 RepID=UPI0036111014
MAPWANPTQPLPGFGGAVNVGVCARWPAAVCAASCGVSCPAAIAARAWARPLSDSGTASQPAHTSTSTAGMSPRRAARDTAADMDSHRRRTGRRSRVTIPPRS